MKKIFSGQIDKLKGLPFYNINFSNHNMYGVDFVIESIDEYNKLLETVKPSEIDEAENEGRIYAEEVMSKSKNPYRGAERIKFIRKCIEKSKVSATAKYSERVWDFFDSLEVSQDSILYAVTYYKDHGFSREFYLDVFSNSQDVANQIAELLKEKDGIGGVTIYSATQPALQISSEMAD